METFKEINNIKIAIVGLGYVGLPLFWEFSRVYKTVGYDSNTKKIGNLLKKHDYEIDVTANPLDIADCNVYIVAVPTPITEDNVPDLSPLTEACEMIGPHLNTNEHKVVIFESTVYPGCTMEHCVPALESFMYTKPYVGYSPERINPGDPDRGLTDIVKITSGSTPEVADFVDDLYCSIINAGTHKAPSIEVAEAAKVVENVQRDVNIALMNELALVFNELSIDTHDVIDAASTKWNFQRFTPGLVGGHCIGVDPYYLISKAQQRGVETKLISSARQVNESISAHIANQIMNLMSQKKIHIVEARILFLGITFKPNCADVRNSKAVDVVRRLIKNNAKVTVFDPVADERECLDNYGIELQRNLQGQQRYDAVIYAVPHEGIYTMDQSFLDLYAKDNCLIYDIPSMLPRSISDGHL